jgi:hypothetical protein
MEIVMKKFLLVSVVLTIVILFSANLFSQNFPERSVQMNENQITTNLLVGIQSCNKGLCASCAYQLGEFRCKKSVIPLLSLLHSSPCEEIRILAALSLIKIGDGRGTFAVKRAGIYDESARVKKLCNLFYKAFLAGKVTNPMIFEDSKKVNPPVIAEN